MMVIVSCNNTVIFVCDIVYNVFYIGQDSITLSFIKVILSFFQIPWPRRVRRNTRQRPSILWGAILLTRSKRTKRQPTPKHTTRPAW